ncbi:MAG TPA: 50S ribosomal protein L21 [Burkholderiales bacterium]|nr:50S ribosomal protein L21 [Burkholderiales bacterium]
MAIYAVIKTGGKQYRVAPGDVVKVEKLGIASGGTVEISEVYLIADDHDITVGHPTIANARVVAEVVEEGRDEKIITFKKNRRKGYQRTIGHRQYFTTLRISEIALGDRVYKAQATVSRPAAPRTITARPARPLPTKADLPKPSAAKIVEAPKAPSPKETAPTQTQTPADRAPPVAVPDVRGRDTVAEPAPVQPPSTTSEPAMAARETTSPMAPPASRMATTEFETARPPDVGADHARSVHTAPAPPTRETEPPHAPAIPQPQAGQTRTYDKRWYWLVAVAVALLLVTGWVLFRDPGRRAPQDAVPAVAQPKETPPPKAKKPVQEVRIKKPTAGAAPSAPVQPPD